MNLSDLLKNRYRVLLVGRPGCGKTARIKATAKDCDFKVVIMRCSLSERIDFGGALIPDVKNGVTKTLPLEILKQLKETKEWTLLFLDDLGQAPIDVQAAIMKLFDNGDLSPFVVIWAATNRPGDKAGVTSLCEPLRSRFDCSFNVPNPEDDTSNISSGVFTGTWKEELDGWCNWAVEAGLDPLVIAYHRMNLGRSLYAWKPSADPSLRFPDYRSWETVGKMLRDGLAATIDAVIGKGEAALFRSFCKHADNLPTIEEIFTKPETAIVPKEPAAAFIVASRIAQSVGKTTVKPFITYIGRMGKVYGALAGRDAHRRHGEAISKDPAFTQWFFDNKELFYATNI